MFSMIKITQLWKGAIPNLISIEIVKINSFIILTPINITTTLSKNNVEATLWIIKYLIMDSDLILLEFWINGIKDNNEISSPIHIDNQLFEQIVIITPIIIVFANKSFVELNMIRKKNFVLYLGYEPNSFY